MGVIFELQWHPFSSLKSCCDFCHICQLETLSGPIFGLWSFLHLFLFFASTSCFCKACQQIGISRPQISVQPNPHFADFCSFEVRFQILTQALETLDVIELTHPFTIMLMPDQKSKCQLRKDFEAMGVDAVKVGRVILTQRDICARKAGM